MNYKNQKPNKARDSRTAPALRELTVATMVDIFYLKEELDQAYEQHVSDLAVVFTTYRTPENGMLISDDLLPYVIRLIESRGYRLFGEETLIGRMNRRILRFEFRAQIGAFPSWPRPAKE